MIANTRGYLMYPSLAMRGPGFISRESLKCVPYTRLGSGAAVVAWLVTWLWGSGGVGRMSAGGVRAVRATCACGPCACGSGPAAHAVRRARR